MPTSIATATVLALAIVPGAFGAYVWALINGQDWREKDREAAVRFLTFSILGLGLYVILGIWLRLPPPVHVIPATYESTRLNADALRGIFIPYLGHIVCAAIVGAVAAGGHRLVCRLRGSSPQPSTWDHFLKNAVPGRWVVATLKSGDVYAGYVQTAEESAPGSERDVILRFPAKFDEAAKNYRVTSYSDLFLPADLVQNMATVRRDDELTLQPVVNSFLFPTSDQNGQTDASST